MNYVFGVIAPSRHACRLKLLQGVDDDFELHKGVSRAGGWSADARFEMNEAYPDRLQLDDFVYNLNDVLVVSEQVTEALEGPALKNNETLPVTIINHKGRRVKAPYYILHQLVLQDCIDRQRSVVRVNEIDPESFRSVRTLVIDEAAVDPEVALFRMARYPALPIFRRDLAERIREAGFTGIRFGEIAEWQGK